jgi:hypothetical protein
MAIRTELNLRVPNSPGTLAAICRLLADERVNITALALDSSGQLRLVVDNSVRAAGILRERHYQVSERDVVLVPVANGPGALAPVLTLAAESGVNVEYAYASAGEGSRDRPGERGRVVDPHAAGAARDSLRREK